MKTVHIKICFTLVLIGLVFVLLGCATQPSSPSLPSLPVQQDTVDQGVVMIDGTVVAQTSQQQKQPPIKSTFDSSSTIFQNFSATGVHANAPIQASLS